MKKLLSIAAALVMAATLTACSFDSGNNGGGTNNNGGTANNSSTENATIDWTVYFVSADFSGSYTGDVKSGIPDGTGAFSGKNDANSTILASGSWKNGKLNGEGKVTVESLDAGPGGEKGVGIEGRFVDNEPTGEIKMTQYFTDEAAAVTGYDRMVLTGKWAASETPLQAPYTVQYYSGDTLVYETVVE